MQIEIIYDILTLFTFLYISNSVFHILLMKIAWALGQRSGMPVTDDEEGLSVWFVFISWLLFKFNSITPNILLLFSSVFLGYFTMESIL